MNSKPTSRKIGAVWLNVSKVTNEEYLSGTLNLPNGQTIDISMSVNKFKGEGDNRPHYIVYMKDYGDLPEQETEAVQHPF